MAEYLKLANNDVEVIVLIKNESLTNGQALLRALARLEKGLSG